MSASHLHSLSPIYAYRGTLLFMGYFYISQLISLHSDGPSIQEPIYLMQRHISRIVGDSYSRRCKPAIEIRLSTRNGCRPND